MFSTPEEADAAHADYLRKKGWKQQLVDGGYPQRHIDKLDVMAGPSFDKAKDLWPRLRDNGLLCLIGERGPGKTQMAVYFAQQMLNEGRKCGKYTKALDFFGAMKATWGGKGDETAVFKRYAESAFLVLDEAQERGDSENDRAWCERTFSLLIDHRYDSMLPTLVVANYTSERYGSDMPASVRSRINETGGVCVCDWPSYRL
jgi:DNA replication protein DnaC